MKKAWRHIVWPGLFLVLLLAGCSSNYYRKSTDKEAYSIIQSKSPAVPNMDTNFTIEATNVLAIESLPQVTKAEDYLGEFRERELGARILSLEDALRVAIQSSRAYQSRKEQLYLATLSLALVRHEFAPIFSGSANLAYGGQTERAFS